MYNRIILKLSGEALGENGKLFDQAMIARAGKVLAEIASSGIEVGVVIGAGNIWRGRQSQDMDAVTADHMGMLGTVINCLCMRDAVERFGAKSVVFSAIDMPRVCEPYNVQSARRAMADKEIVFFAGGSGNPFFTTDTAVVMRAAEMKADALLIAKNIDGVYDKDPRKFPDAVKFDTVSFDSILEDHLGVIDSTAATMAYDNDLPVLLFGIDDPENIYRAVMGEHVGTIVRK